MDVFYALAEPRRRRIIEILAGRGQLSANEISGNFDISPQAISQHLKVLLDCRLLLMHRKAQQRIYQINPISMLELEDWAKNTVKMWNERLRQA